MLQDVLRCSLTTMNRNSGASLENNQAFLARSIYNLGFVEADGRDGGEQGRPGKGRLPKPTQRATTQPMWHNAHLFILYLKSTTNYMLH